MLFLMPNQQRQSTEGKPCIITRNPTVRKLLSSTCMVVVYPNHCRGNCSFWNMDLHVSSSLRFLSQFSERPVFCMKLCSFCFNGYFSGEPVLTGCPRPIFSSSTHLKTELVRWLSQAFTNWMPFLSSNSVKELNETFKNILTPRESVFWLTTRMLWHSKRKQTHNSTKFTTSFHTSN